MRVEVELLDHPKFLRLERRLGPEAIKVLLRIWGHCQACQRGETWRNADAEYVEVVARWSGDEGVCFEALRECGFIHQKGRTIVIHDWEEMNAWIVKNWTVGKKGGRPPKGGGRKDDDPPSATQTDPPPEPNDPPPETLGFPQGSHTETQCEPSAKPIRERERKRDITPCSPPGGDAAGEFQVPEPPTVVTKAIAASWLAQFRDAGADFTDAEFDEAWRLCHSTRDQRSGSWLMGRRGLVTDPRAFLEQRLHDARARRQGGRNGGVGGLSPAAQAVAVGRQIDALKAELESHKGRPGSDWPEETIRANSDDFRAKKARLKSLTEFQQTLLAPHA